MSDIAAITIKMPVWRIRVSLILCHAIRYLPDATKDAVAGMLLQWVERGVKVT